MHQEQRKGHLNPTVAGKEILRKLQSGLALSRAEMQLRIPGPPIGVPLGALGFDNRTRRALERRGFEDNPAKLGTLTIEKILDIPGFGRGCLQAYIQAAQAWVGGDAHHESVPAVTVTEYLRDILRSVKTGSLLGVRRKRLPDFPTPDLLYSLNLSTRTRNCLIDNNIGPSGRQLSEFTIGNVLSFHAFGRTSLINLLEELAKAYASAPTAYQCPEASAEADVHRSRRTATLVHALRLRNAIGDCLITANDCRFGSELRSLGYEDTDTLVRDLESSLITSEERIQAVVRVIEIITQAIDLTVEEEALALRDAKSGSRKAAMIRAYFGFSSLGARTLADVGRIHGLTRERVRQICAPPGLRAVASSSFTPSVSHVAQCISEEAPVLSATLESKLQRTGLVEPHTRVGDIIRYAKATGLEVGAREIELDGVRLVLRESMESDVRDIVSRTKRLISVHGATTPMRVSEDAQRARQSGPAPKEVESLVNLLPSFRIIDRDPAWIISTAPPNDRLLIKIARILSVGGKLTVRDTRNALRRDYRHGALVPPSRVLHEVLLGIPGIRLVDGRLVMDARLRGRADLGRSSEAVMVEMLRDAGGVSERRQLLEMAKIKGISEPRFWQIVNYSPFLQRLYRGVYGLVGVTPPPGLVEEMHASRKAVKGGTIDRGWTDDGRLWVGYRISTSTIETGIVGIPASIRPTLGDEYSIAQKTTETERKLKLGDAQAWGFRPTILDAGAEPGDVMVFVFDLKMRNVQIRFGDESLIDDLAGMDN